MTAGGVVNRRRDDSAVQLRRERSVRRAFARLALLLPAMLYACGSALCVVLGQQLDVFTENVILWSCAATLVLAIVLYNHWTMLATAFLAGIAALLAWRFFEPEELQALIEDIALRWEYATGFLLGGAEYDEMLEGTLLAFIIVSCSAISTVLIYRLRNALVPALFALALFMIEWSLGSTEILPALWPVVLACAMTLAVRGFRRAYAKPVQAVALATAVAVLSCTVAFAFVPRDTTGFRSSAVERVLDNVNDLFSDYTGYQRPHTAFSISRVGYLPLGNRLGGAVELADMDLLRVSSTSPGLLRGMVRNYYDGQMWVRSASIKTYRMDNPLIRATQERVMGLDIPDVPELESAFAKELTFTVSHIGDMSSTLFTAGRVRTIRIGSGDIITNYDENGESFAKRTIAPGSSYTVSARVPAVNASAFDASIRTLYSQNLLSPVSEETRARNAFLYLGLPEDYSTWVKDETERVISEAGAQTDWEKAVAIRDYLSESFTYTMTPDDPPEDVDFVEYFLRTGEGYCTYFASAMAVMARTQGLPSRYVEGFQLDGSRRVEQGYIVNAKQAHAWAEVYIEGIGWLTFDATPRQATASSSGGSGGVVEMPIPTPPPIEPEADLGDPGTPRTPLNVDVPWWAWSAAAFATLVIVFFSLLARHNRRWESERLFEKHPEEKTRTVMIWRDILRIYSLTGLGIKVGDTPLAYARRVDEAVNNPEGKLLPIAEVYVRAVYGGIIPDEKLLGKANAYRGEADVSLRKSMGRARFLFARALRRMPEGRLG